MSRYRQLQCRHAFHYQNGVARRTDSAFEDGELMIVAYWILLHGFSYGVEFLSLVFDGRGRGVRSIDVADGVNYFIYKHDSLTDRLEALRGGPMGEGFYVGLVGLDPLLRNLSSQGLPAFAYEEGARRRRSQGEDFNEEFAGNIGDRGTYGFIRLCVLL
jgi:hypothetical protein